MSISEVLTKTKRSLKTKREGRRTTLNKLQGIENLPLFCLKIQMPTGGRRENFVLTVDKVYKKWLTVNWYSTLHTILLLYNL